MNYYVLTYSGGTAGASGEQCGTEYNFDCACKDCGTETELKGHLRARGVTKTKKSFFETVNGDCLISKDLKEIIVKKLPDFEVEQVFDTKNQPLNLFHLYTRKSLPRFKESSTGYVTEDQCPICQRDGYFNDVTIGWPTVVKPFDFRYDCKDFGMVNEIVLKTWECSGLSNKVKSGNKVVRFARPWLIVREDLKEILENENVKSIHFEQILIEGCV